MRTSDAIDKIAPALLAAQRLIGGAVKDKTGKIQTKTGSYEYRYSDLSSVIDEIKGPLNDNGIMLLQSPTADATGVCVITRLLHESGQWIEESLYMPITQATPQAYGSAITYCRRYSAQAMTGCKAMDDDGKAASDPPPEKPLPRPIPANLEGHELLAAMGAEERAFLEDNAKTLIHLHEIKGDMYGWIKEAKLDTEELLALSVLLPAPVRAEIKRQQAAARAKQQPSLASQA